MKKAIDYILDELNAYDLGLVGPLYARFLVEKSKLGLSFLTLVDLDELGLDQLVVDKLVELDLLVQSDDVYMTSDCTEDLILTAFEKFSEDNPRLKSATRTKRSVTDVMTKSKDYIEELINDHLNIRRSFVDRSNYIIVIEKSKFGLKNIEVRHNNELRIILRKPSKEKLESFGFALKIKESKDVAYIDFDCSNETIEKVLTVIKGTI